jgi:hypothetical protein
VCIVVFNRHWFWVALLLDLGYESGDRTLIDYPENTKSVK